MGADDVLHCLHRLRALQAHVCGAEGLDGLLLLGGVDGRNHAGSREALGWLLSGLNGRDVFGSGRADADLDEAVIIVMKDAVRLYAPTALWERIQPLVSRWRRLQVWTPEAALNDDVEAVEAHKIRSFIAMLRGVRVIGVPLQPSEETAATGPSAAVESWPLVQSFALQDFEHLTGGGFFTQAHTVRCVGDSLRSLLLQIDRPSLTWLAHSEAPRLTNCLKECMVCPKPYAASALVTRPSLAHL